MNFSYLPTPPQLNYFLELLRKRKEITTRELDSEEILCAELLVSRGYVLKTSNETTSTYIHKDIRRIEDVRKILFPFRYPQGYNLETNSMKLTQTNRNEPDYKETQPHDS